MGGGWVLCVGWGKVRLECNIRRVIVWWIGLGEVKKLSERS